MKRAVDFSDEDADSLINLDGNLQFKLEKDFTKMLSELYNEKIPELG